MLVRDWVLLVRQANMHEAKTHLSRLVKAGRPMVRVTRLYDGEAVTAPRRRLGLLAGHCQVPDDFDQLAAAEIADWFEGS